MESINRTKTTLSSETLPPTAITASADVSVSSVALLDANGVLRITHNGEVYQLRRTRSGKLLLTK